MNVHGDVIFDAIKNRDNLIKWKLLVALLLILTVWSLSSPTVNNKVMNKPYIARVYIEGEIIQDAKFKQALADMVEDKNIKAVIMHVNSPGGGFFASEDLYHSIRKIAEKKPTVAVVEAVAASGGYMAAIGTDYIVARFSSITGSIGVVFSAYEIEELSKKIGVNFYEVKTPKMKAEPSLFTKPSPEALKIVRDDIEDGYKFFAKLVAGRRKIKLDDLMRFSDGRVFSGQKALEFKLIDQIGGEDEALGWLRTKAKISDKLEVKNYLHDESPFVDIINDFGTALKSVRKMTSKLQWGFELRS